MAAKRATEVMDISAWSGIYVVLSQMHTQQRAHGTTGALEDHTDGNWATYAIACTRQGNSRRYTYDVPTGLPEGQYQEVFYGHTGSAALTDEILDRNEFFYDTTADAAVTLLPLAGITAHGGANQGLLIGSGGGEVLLSGAGQVAVGVIAVGAIASRASEVAAAVWDALLSSISTASSIGKKLKDWTLGADNKGLLSSDIDVYFARIQFTRDQSNTVDEYTVQWFKNGAPVTSGITSPTIQVVKRADGTDLIASTALTQIGSTGAYKFTTTTSGQRQTKGEAVVAVVGATIDGSSRPWRDVLGRDSGS